MYLNVAFQFIYVYSINSPLVGMVPYIPVPILIFITHSLFNIEWS